MTPTARVVELIPPDYPGEPWRVVVACPFCFEGRGKKRRPGRHGHGLGRNIRRPLLGSRVSDCSPGGTYLLGPLPKPYDRGGVPR